MDSVVLAAADHDYLWHPYTQQREWEQEPPVVVVRGDGAILTDIGGKEYIDGVASLAGNIHGHRHHKLDIAVADQLHRVAHTSLHGLTHPGAIELAKTLVEISPDGLSRVFYSDSGTESITAALRMAFHYWQHRGKTQRTRFICTGRSAHGDAISQPSFPTRRDSAFHTLLCDALVACPGDTCDLHGLLRRYSSEVAAIVVEPIVECAGGVRVHPEGYLRTVRDLCNEFDVLLISNELNVGLWRTGTVFASEHENVAPDLLCLGSSLTGGYLPFGATLATDAIYEAFLGKQDKQESFSHGTALAGNPLACAAARANLELLEEELEVEELTEKIELLGTLLRKHVIPLPAVADVHHKGLIAGIELGNLPEIENAGRSVELAARKRGAIVRSTGETILLMPPLSISPELITRLVAITAAAIGEVTAESRDRHGKG
jgi:adenosylmethionine-8-amino-7-oxononanoate aminotransferase